MCDVQKEFIKEFVPVAKVSLRPLVAEAGAAVVLPALRTQRGLLRAAVLAAECAKEFVPVAKVGLGLGLASRAR